MLYFYLRGFSQLLLGEMHPTLYREFYPIYLK